MVGDIGKAKATKDEATASKLMAEVATLKEQIASGEEAERGIDADIKKMLDAQHERRSTLQAVLNYLEILKLAGLVEW